MLTIVETHPVQYHAPVYRAVHLRYGIPVRVVYGSDFSVAGYRDREFGASFAWDVDLLAGYESMFVSRGSDGGPGAFEQVSSRGLKKTLEATGNGPILLLGYSGAFHRAAFLHSALNRRAILFRAETTDHARSRRPITRLARDQVLRTVYRRCTRLLYIGRRSADHYRRILGSDEKLVFSPYCVDVTPFQLGEASRARLREEVRSELDLRGRHVVLFSGKLTSRKGVDGLLHAVKRMDAAERRLLAVVFVGDGELRAALQGQAASSPPVDVRFVGFRNQRELSRYYHAADSWFFPAGTPRRGGLSSTKRCTMACPVS